MQVPEEVFDNGNHIGSCYLPDFDQTLKVGYWDTLEQIPTAMMTFVQATSVLTIFVHIKNISAVTDPIFIKF